VTLVLAVALDLGRPQQPRRGPLIAPGLGGTPNRGDRGRAIRRRLDAGDAPAGEDEPMRRARELAGGGRTGDSDATRRRRWRANPAGCDRRSLPPAVLPQRQSAAAAIAEPSFDHLDRLTDDVGLFERAWGIEPRPGCGYTTDDTARALVRVVLEPGRNATLERLETVYFEFLHHARRDPAHFHKRCAGATDPHWLDRSGADDTTARAIRALAAAAVHGRRASTRRRALRLFHDSWLVGSRRERATANLALAAAQIMAADPKDLRARRMLERTAASFRPPAADPGWPWPEPRLRYENALLAEARIIAGATLKDNRLLATGLRLLEWLEAAETAHDHFSFAPAGGWAPGEPRPGFDQQPVEAGAMATACAAAWRVTGETRWAAACLRAARWFLGENDVGVPLLDPWSGGCHDGLGAHGVNVNESAESTIALIAALQEARWAQDAAAAAPACSAAGLLRCYPSEDVAPLRASATSSST
jgi:hypothetical protein